MAGVCCMWSKRRIPFGAHPFQNGNGAAHNVMLVLQIRPYTGKQDGSLPRESEGAMASPGKYQQFRDRYDGPRWKRPDLIVLRDNNPVVSKS